MIEVKWVDRLEPQPEMTPLQAFDEWFNLVNDEQARKEWAVVRSVYTDEKVLIAWARIIELNRVDRVSSCASAQPVTRTDRIA